MENATLVSFVCGTVVAGLSSVAFFFGVMWWRERTKRKTLERRLRSQEASFAAALGQTKQTLDETRQQTERIIALEHRLREFKPMIDELGTILAFNRERR
jgi:hypothetical protein